MKRSLLATSLFALMAVSGLTGCNNKKADFSIGISQFVPVDALNNATQGFVDKVKEGMEAAGKTVDFDIQLASGDIATCSTIASTFASKKKDLIMANATPCLQAAASATATIPVLGTSITEYGVALNISDVSQGTGINVSGTSDLAPLETQAQMVVSNFPEATTVGLLYCTNEANSIYQVNKVEAELQRLGKQTRRITFAQTSELEVNLRGVINNIDALYIPTDNQCANATSTIDAVCSEKNIPVFAGEEGMCKECGAFTLSINYYTLGQITGEMALEILLEGKDVSTMKIRLDESPVKKYNPVICQRLGITPPSDYVAIEMGE